MIQNHRLPAGVTLIVSVLVPMVGHLSFADEPVLAHKIDVSGFGTWTGLRLGELDGDGRLAEMIPASATARLKPRNLSFVASIAGARVR